MRYRLLLVLIAFIGTAAAQSFYPIRYDNNVGYGGTLEQLVRIINVGKLGTPVTSPVGDVCANIYVFDANQEMVACCSCRVTPDGMASAAVGNQLTSNPLTGSVPMSGVIEILPIPAGPQTCSPIAPFSTPDGSLVDISATHIEVANGLGYVTETAVQSVAITSQQTSFLNNACLFVQFLGNSAGKGGCGCSNPGS